MKFRLYKLEELKNSRIFFEKCPANYLYNLFIITCLIICSSLIATSIIDKNYIVNADGYVTYEDKVYISSYADGVIIKQLKKEGEFVKENEVMFTMSNGLDGVQYSSLIDSKDKEIEKKNLINLYINSLNQNKNLLNNSGEQQEYYNKIEYYLSILSSENQTNNFQMDILSKKQQTKINLEDEKVELEEKLEEIEKVDENKDIIADYETKIEGKQNEINIINSEIDSLSQANNSQSQANLLKLQLISEAGASLSTIDSKLIELDGQLSLYNMQDNLNEIKASCSGYVHYLSPINIGMSIQKGKVIAEISKENKSDITVEVYVNASDISKIKVEDKVKVEINGVNITKFGTIEGDLKHIDSGSITQETSDGTLFLYRCIVQLDKAYVKSKDGEKIELINSMPVKARIIYDNETYMEWILNMLNFIN